MKRCSLCNLPQAICRCAEDTNVQPIMVFVEKRKYDKSVTIVAGLSKAQCQEIFKTLKSLCGCGGAIKDDKMEFQGDHRERIELFLEKNNIR